MIPLHSDLEGKIALFGEAKHVFEKHGYVFGGNWDYHCGCFDSILHRDGGETVYLRVPFCVVDGELDRYDAHIQFETPYIVNHIVNVGIDKEGTSLLGAALNQFQEPLDPDGPIQQKSYWEKIGQQSLERVIQAL